METLRAVRPFGGEEAQSERRTVAKKVRGEDLIGRKTCGSRGAEGPKEKAKLDLH